jgi:AGZA family xanthine/uracil permease-like MFS transporter
LVITILVLTGFRQAVMEAIPMVLKRSIAVGIGLFILFIGLVDVGFVVLGVPGAPVSLGKLATPAMAVAVFALVVTAWMEAKKIKGSLLWGILLSTIFAILINAWTKGAAYAGSPGVAVLPATWLSMPNFSNFGQGLNFGVFGKIGFLGAVLAIFSIMLSDFFDTLGTLVGVGEQAGFLSDNGNYPPDATKRLLLVDSLGAAFGGFAGASSNTTYIESGAGVSEGGRTGLASVVTGLLFLFCMVLAPVAGIIPPQATGPALVIVGLVMFRANIKEIVKDIPEDRGEAMVILLPMLLTMLVMPFTYSITNGIGAGFVAYTVLKLLTGKAREVHWMLWLSSAAFVLYFVTR